MRHLDVKMVKHGSINLQSAARLAAGTIVVTLLPSLILGLAGCSEQVQAAQNTRDQNVQSSAPGTSGSLQPAKSAESTPALTAAERRWLDAKHTVRVQVGDWPPYTFAQPVPSGISVDYIDAIAKRFGIAVEYVPGRFGWSEAMRDVKGERRHFDLLLTMHRSPEREKDFAMTANYLRMPWAIYARKDGPFITGLDSLKGRTVAAEKGYFMTGKLKADHPDIKISEVSRAEDALRAVSSGQADAYGGNLVNAGFLIRELGLANLVVAAPTPYGDHTNAMAVRKDWPELASLIDKGLAAMAANERDAIHAKWEPQKVISRIDYTLVWQIVSVAVLIIVVFLSWNRKLTREIARRRRIEAELRCSKNAAEAANRAKSVFLANMSHELRTPLNAILGFSDIVRRSPGLSDDQKANLSVIHKSGDHLLGLINDVLDLAKIESGRTQIKNAVFDLVSLIGEIADMIRVRAMEKGLQLIVDQSPEFPRYVIGDQTKLRQVLINLLSNAVKATQCGGVALRLGILPGAPGRLVFEVEDTGIGIAPEDQERIFDAFVQSGASGQSQGTGLGLAIARQFIILMGGQLSLSSEIGKGSTFRIELPLDLARAEDLPEAAPERGEVIGLESGQPEYRVLIVDDNLENRLLLKQLLSGVGYSTQEAGNGADAIDRFLDWKPQFIWMDQRMPVMDGSQATRRIRALPGGDAVRIAAVTASSFREEDAMLLEAGFDAIVHKPFRAEEIHDQMEKLLGVKLVRAAPTAVSARQIEEQGLQSIAALSSELRQALGNALISLDGDSIKAVLAEIGKTQPGLAAVLGRMVDNYDCQPILDALERKPVISA
ncbi:transporter substrate-binding domain-containing protein [Accumulibacter sp.]|uniref:ATP-binding protein n=1 Tax=Accumulibacter sp. TaxID=2053492 RepID=UPI002D1FBE3E|nr:transporter substrate-binding domain-containing protein [Accumulibacter sp.]